MARAQWRPDGAGAVEDGRRERGGGLRGMARGRVEERGEGGTGGADGERRAAARRTEKFGSLTAGD